MKNFLTLLIFAILAAFLSSCTADGEVDTDALHRYVDKLEEKFPTKEEFKRMAEERIAKLPADEQAQAREDLRKALAEYPSKEELTRSMDEAIDKVAEEMPNRAEFEEMIGEVSKDLPTKDELHELVDQLPEGEKVEEMISKGLAGFFKAMDSLAVEIKEEKQQ